MDIQAIADSLVALVQGGWGYGMGPEMMGGWGYGMGWFAPLIMMLFWVAVIVGIVFIIRWAVLGARGHDRGPHGDEAMDILRRRFANGDISKEEFEERKRALKS